MNDILFALGYLAIGFVVGIIVARKNKTVDGTAMAALSVLAWPLVLGILLLFVFFGWVQDL